MIATWSIFRLRNFSTVLICSAAPPKAKAALIFCGCSPGISAKDHEAGLKSSLANLAAVVEAAVK